MKGLLSRVANASQHSRKALMWSGALVFVCGYFMTDWVYESLAAAAIYTPPRADMAAPTVDTHALPSLKVSPPASLVGAEANANLETVFGVASTPKGAAAEPAKAAEPDYVAVLLANVTVDAVSSHGAYLSGTWYAIGEGLPPMIPPQGGKGVVPVVESVEGSAVFIRIGKKVVKLMMEKTA